jgi:hypothetical protein
MWRDGNVTKTNPTVRIIAVPPGEAPLWVREKWVGLDLPLARHSSGKKFRTFGALSGPHTFLAQLWAIVRGRAASTVGHPVDAAGALEILEIASPEAAAWWRENTPQFIAPKRYLIFHQEVCQIVGV